jgi:ribosomal protein S18 acetylase RimI-like enzyme
MRLQLSTTSDIQSILKIINDAKVYLKSQKIDQWQNGYPNQTQIERDIANNESYVLINDANQVIATSMFSIRPEPTYKVIDGEWKIKESEKYGVIHRLAIDKNYRKKGIASHLLNEFHLLLDKQQIRSLKIDTHEDNHEMQCLVKKLGYVYCGIIFTEYNAKRFAFEKVIF